MATHSSILAWRIPWTEEPCRPQSIEQQRIRSDLAYTLLLDDVEAGPWAFHCSFVLQRFNKHLLGITYII